jgi:hypothetical protein
MALLGGVFLLLGFIGSRPVAEPYLTAGQLLTALYFLLLGSPLLHRLVLLRPATNQFPAAVHPFYPKP